MRGDSFWYAFAGSPDEPADVRIRLRLFVAGEEAVLLVDGKHDTEDGDTKYNSFTFAPEDTQVVATSEGYSCRLEVVENDEGRDGMLLGTRSTTPLLLRPRIRRWSRPLKVIAAAARRSSSFRGAARPPADAVSGQRRVPGVSSLDERALTLLSRPSRGGQRDAARAPTGCERARFHRFLPQGDEEPGELPDSSPELRGEKPIVVNSPNRIDAVARAGTRRVLIQILFLNLAVSLAKVIAGIASHSLAVLSDGLHSSVDAINNVVGIVLLRLAAKEPDEGHPYGHAKIETLGAFSIAGFMFITCYEVGKQALVRLFGDAPPSFQITSTTFVVMLGTLMVNVFVVIYEKRAARRYSSEFLYADAVHTQSDVGVTMVVLVGLPLVLRGYLYLDAILALGISLFIAYSGFQVLQRTVPTLIDAAAVDAEVIRKMAIGLPRVVAARDIRSRLHGGRKFVELTLIVAENDLREAHDATERLEELIMARYGHAEITIHYEPASSVAPPRR